MFEKKQTKRCGNCFYYNKPGPDIGAYCNVSVGYKNAGKFACGKYKNKAKEVESMRKEDLQALFEKHRGVDFYFDIKEMKVRVICDSAPHLYNVSKIFMYMFFKSKNVSWDNASAVQSMVSDIDVGVKFILDNYEDFESGTVYNDNERCPKIKKFISNVDNELPWFLS